MAVVTLFTIVLIPTPKQHTGSNVSEGGDGLTGTHRSEQVQLPRKHLRSSSIDKRLSSITDKAGWGRGRKWDQNRAIKREIIVIMGRNRRKAVW